jgi:hypothetical protein
MRALLGRAVLAALASAVPASLLACENDGIPGYNHATGLIDADPYAGAYTEVAERVACDQRDAAMERARIAFIQRLGLNDSDPTARSAPVASAMAAPDVQPH